MNTSLNVTAAAGFLLCMAATAPSQAWQLTATYDNHPLGKWTATQRASDFPKSTLSTQYGWDTFDIVSDGAGGKALRTYFQGCSQPKHLYMNLPAGTEEVTLKTSVRFSPNFRTSQKSPRSGKLWIGVQGAAGGYSYAPSSQPINAGQSYSSLLMWTGGGKIQDYTYHMDRTGQWGSANAFFGTVGTAWNDITVQTRLNTPGKKDGFLRIWHNGTKVLDKPMAFVGSELVGYWDALRFLGTIGGTCSTSENYFTQLSYIDYRYHTIITP